MKYYLYYSHRILQTILLALFMMPEFLFNDESIYYMKIWLYHLIGLCVLDFIIGILWLSRCDLRYHAIALLPDLLFLLPMAFLGMYKVIVRMPILGIETVLPVLIMKASMMILLVLERLIQFRLFIQQKGRVA